MSEHDCHRESTRVGAFGLVLSILIVAGLCFSTSSTANAWQGVPPVIEPPIIIGPPIIIEPPIEPPGDGICGPDCIFGELTCGTDLTADFPKGTCNLERGSPVDYYTLEVAEGSEQVTINLTAPYDTYLALYDADCVLIELDDDGGDGLNSQITRLLDAGTYLVGTSSFSAASSGNFVLNASCREPFDQAALCNDCVIAEADCGGETTGAFPESACVRETGEEIDLYMVDVPPEGGRLLLTLESTEFSPHLELYDESCVTIGTAGGINDVARLNIEVFGGLHFVGVSSAMVQSAGQFTLTVECRQVVPPDRVCAECQVGEIACDGTVDGNFPQTGCMRPNGGGQQVDIHQFEVEDDLEYIIDLTAGYDTFLELYDADCNRIAFNDDVGGGNFNSRMAQFLTAGTYFIGASSYSAAQTAAGPYTLAITCRDPIELCLDCEVALISCAIPEEGIFPMTECTRSSGQGLDLYSLVIAGGELTIDLTGDYDTYMQFFDENCVLLTFDDDGGDGLNSRLVMPDLAAGVYYVGVSSYGQGAGGGFNLTATCQSGDNFCVRCRVDTLQPEVSMTGTLGESECTLPPFDLSISVYAFQINEPFAGRIVVSSDIFDPTVALFNDLCDETAFNDNCGAGSDAACLNVELEPGSYSLVVSSEDPAAAGEFSIMALPLSADSVFSRGDGNGDGTLELTDAVIVLNYLFLGGTEPACLEGADADNDGSVSLTDGILVLQYLFQGGNAPALPGPPGVNSGCGPDTDIPGTPGDLGCVNYSGCE